MTRLVRITEPVSGMSIRCKLLDDKAPRSAEFLWQLAKLGASYEAIHAIWTGPELSCPLPASVLPKELSDQLLPLENSTSYPGAGDIALVCVRDGSIKDVPPGNYHDLGIFYDEGGRLLFPFGWLKGNICAKVDEPDLAKAQSSMAQIRRSGACSLLIECE